VASSELLAPGAALSRGLVDSLTVHATFFPEGPPKFFDAARLISRQNAVRAAVALMCSASAISFHS